MTGADTDEHAASGIRRPDLSRAPVALEPCPKRVRTVFNHETVADSTRVRLLHERGTTPVYYFATEDVRTDLLEPGDRSYHCPRKGDARFWSLTVGERTAEDAAWNYPEPIDECPDISNLIAFYWDAMDAWFEEDEEVFVHPRDPYTRIDVLESSRRIEVEVGGATVADSERPALLFETGLPVRYYLPKGDVRMRHLRPTDTGTRCPYKGTASRYWSVEAGGETVEDAAWCYEHPNPEAWKIAGRIAFFSERVGVRVDGELQADADSPRA